MNADTGLEAWENVLWHARALQKCCEDLGAAMYPPQVRRRTALGVGQVSGGPPAGQGLGRDRAGTGQGRGGDRAHERTQGEAALCSSRQLERSLEGSKLPCHFNVALALNHAKIPTPCAPRPAVVPVDAAACRTTRRSVAQRRAFSTPPRCCWQKSQR